MDARKEIEATIAKLQKRAQELQPFVTEAKNIDGAIGSLETSLSFLSSNGSSPPPLGSLATGQQPEKKIYELVADILRENGKPMRASEILRVMNTRGRKMSQPVLANAVMRKIGTIFNKPKTGVYELIEPPKTGKGLEKESGQDHPRKR